MAEGEETTTPGVLPVRPLSKQQSSPPKSGPPGGKVRSSGGARPLTGPGTRAAHLPAGTMLGGRYRLTRYLARGGMGEVYEALDVHMKETVALKTLLPNIAQDTAMLERFRKEIQLARKVTHPNVCRVHDLAVHQDPGAPPVWFLTMELLNGDTLAGLIKKKGRLDVQGALGVARQLANALDAAHRAGVVHRDLKPGNVMLVPGAGGATRVVVTDFGLAHATESPTSSADANALVGTPGYMAPEQIQGAGPTPAMDIYALGSVLFEMVTGARPFEEEDPYQEAARKLAEPPPSPRALALDLPPVWERMIHQCLSPAPKDRPAHAVDVVQALDVPVAAAAETKAESPSRGGAARLVPVLAGIALASAGAALLVARLVGTPAVTASNTTGQPSAAAAGRVALLGFKNLGQRAEAAWLSTALTEMLATELVAGGIPVVPGEDVARMRVELRLKDVDGNAATVGDICRNLGAQLVVTGTYTWLPPKGGGAAPLRLDVRLKDASGTVVAALDETGADDALLAMVDRLGSALRRQLGVTTPVDTGGAARAALPRTPQAAQWYAQGLERLRALDPSAALEPLQKAAALEEHPLIHRELSNAWRALGQDAKAKQEAFKAFETSKGLPELDRLLVEARWRLLSGDVDAALAIHAAQRARAPKDPEMLLRYLDTLRHAGRAQDALLEVQRVRDAGEGGDNARLDLEEASAASDVGDFRRQLTAAQAAVNHANLIGATLLAARAKILVASAQSSLGMPEDAARNALEARQALADAGDNKGAADALNVHANLLLTQGKLAEAKAQYEAARAVLEVTGNKRGEAVVSHNIAQVLSLQGNHQEAARAAEHALRLATLVQDDTVMAMALQSAANAMREMGQLKSARANFERALTLDRAQGNAYGVAVGQSNMALILLMLGEVQRAHDALEEAQRIFAGLGNRSAAVTALVGRADALALLGRYKDAGRLLEEAATERTALKETGTLAQTRVSQAQLAAWEGRPQDAEKLLEEALPVLVSQDMDEDVVYARLIQADVALSRGHLEDAQTALNATHTLLAGSVFSPVTQMTATLLEARVKAATGKLPEARKLVARVMTEAQDKGYVVIALEARRAALDVDARTLKPAALRARAKALDADARKAGLQVYVDQVAPFLKAR